MTKYVENLQPPCTNIILIGPSYAIIGSIVSLIAEVYPPLPGYGVIFSDNGNQIGTVPTNGDGIASFDWDTSNVVIQGNHSIMASAGGCLPMVIIIDMTYSSCTISLSADPLTVEQGGMVTLTANTNAAPTTSYRILFKDEGNVIANIYLQPDGTATWFWDTSVAFIGPHNVTVDAMIITNGFQCTGGTTVIVNLSGCVPNWQCELPINGYESDGCGNRRLNPICNITLGDVQIMSTPTGARIYIDDIDTGSLTPVTILDLISGYHTYKLTLTGYVDATGMFDIVAEQTTPINILMAQMSYPPSGGGAIILGLAGVVVIGMIITSKPTIYTSSGKRARIVGGDYGKETFSRRTSPGHRTVGEITTAKPKKLEPFFTRTVQ